MTWLCPNTGTYLRPLPLHARRTMLTCPYVALIHGQGATMHDILIRFQPLPDPALQVSSYVNPFGGKALIDRKSQ